MKFKIIPNEQTPKATQIVVIEEDLKLLHKFYSFARRQHSCAGLAANQVACDGERIMKTFFAIHDNHFWDIVINPIVVQYMGKSEEKEEGCLTWLGKTIIADRYPAVKVSYYNLSGDFIEEVIEGDKAQIWQHEYNHLMGIEEKFKEEIK